MGLLGIWIVVKAHFKCFTAIKTKTKMKYGVSQKINRAVNTNQTKLNFSGSKVFPPPTTCPVSIAFIFFGCNFLIGKFLCLEKVLDYIGGRPISLSFTTSDRH